jgi:hypothetical protein
LDLLKQLEGSPKRNILSLELELRICFALSEAYTIIEDFEAAHLYASRMAIIAPTVGLKNFIASGRGLVGWCLLMLGKVEDAASTYKQLLITPDFSHLKLGHTVYFAFASFWNGDDYTLKNLLSPVNLPEIGGDLPDELENAKGFRALTLGLKVDSFDLESRPKRFLSLIKTHMLISEGLQLSPYEGEKKEKFRLARLAVLEYSENSNIWLFGAERALSALCSIRVGDYGLALQSMPRVPNLTDYPLWAKYLTLSTALELAIRHNYSGSEQMLLESYFAIRSLILKTSDSILKQIVEKLQLLTPWSLSFIATLGGVPDYVISAGLASIMHFKSRPIKVYDHEGLRPVQACEFIAGSFDIFQDQNTRLGGGQLEALTKCLKRSYGEHNYWYEPVSPTRLIVILIQAAYAAATKRGEDSSEIFSAAALSTAKHFGIVPQIQQTKPLPWLDNLEFAINQALYQYSAIPNIWRVVEAHRGY